MIFAYVRVSTDEQDNGPEAQRRAIEARGLSIDEWREDRASGKSLDRPEIADILARIQPGDTLVVAKLDRLSRSVVDAGMIMKRAITEGWNIITLDLGVDLSTPAGKMVATVVMAMAEFERELIVDRTKAGMAIVKLNGTKSGRPIGRPRTIPDATALRIREMADAGKSLRDIGRAVNLGHTSVRRVLARA